MGGLGRTINGSYAEFTRVPVTNVAPIESGLSWAELAAIPETFATAWTCLFRNLEIASGQTLVIRGATSSFGQAAVNMSVNAGAKVIATTRSAIGSLFWRRSARFGRRLKSRNFPNGLPRPERSMPSSTWSAIAPFSIHSTCCAGAVVHASLAGWAAWRRSLILIRYFKWPAASI